jgi:ketosteroid isomerase-like protein
MVALDDFDEAVRRCQIALGEFVEGNPEPMKEMFSHREEVSLANPFGPPARGWQQVEQIMDLASSNIRDGEIFGFEDVAKYSTPELAYIVWIERAEVGRRYAVARFDLRATLIPRPEEGIWKVVHRHADPITSARPVESVLRG